MVFVDPLFQRCLIDVVRSAAGKGVEGQREWKGLPVIFDEGMGFCFGYRRCL